MELSYTISDILKKAFSFMSFHMLKSLLNVVWEWLDLNPDPAVVLLRIISSNLINSVFCFTNVIFVATCCVICTCELIDPNMPFLYNLTKNNNNNKKITILIWQICTTSHFLGRHKQLIVLKCCKSCTDQHNYIFLK